MSLRSHVARLALEHPELQPALSRVVRKASDESDAEAKFEKGEKVPLSKMPKKLQDNAKNPPPEAKALKDKLKKKAGWNRNTLDQLVEMAAEANGDDWKSAQATPEVIREANSFERAVSKALSVWAQKHPPEDGSDVGDLMDTRGAYLVFMTLEGHGVGIWDGEWDRFYSDTRSLQRFLERALARDHQKFVNAIENAAYETAGGE